MFEFFMFVVLVLGLIGLVNYFKSLAPELRKEQLKTARQSGEIIAGFLLTTGKDAIKTASKAGKAAAVSVERNHAELSHDLAQSVGNFVADKGKGNALRAGAQSSKDMQEYIGLNGLDDYLNKVIKPETKPVE